ncbi:MAG: PH domain-containing protein [Myxococcota bacterium]
MAESDDWRTLHPASVAVNLIPTAWRAVRSLWPLLLAIALGGRGGRIDTFEVMLLGFVFGVPVWRTVLHWLTLRYRVKDGRLEIQSGIVYRQARVIPPERIQNVELVRNVFHRLSGLVEVKVETASGTDIEGQLSALSVGEAGRLMAALDAARQRVRPDPTEEVDVVPLVENDLFDLVRYGLSTARLGLAVVALGVLYESVLSLDPTSGAETAVLTLGTVGTAAVVLVLVLGAWIGGAALSIVRHWGFRLVKGSDTLVSEEGLFTRRRVELSGAKIQLVTLSQSVLRRMLGFGTLQLETAAAREEGGTQTAEAVIPVLPDDRVATVLRAALPDAPDLAGLPMSPPHPRAVQRAMIGTTIRVGLVSAFLAWLFFPTGLVALGLVPAALFATWFDHRHQGWWVGERHVVSRTGWWVRQTRIVAREKLQSLELVQGPLARRWGLGHLRIRVAGSSVLLPVIDFDQALELELELSTSLPSVVVVRGVEAPRVLVLLDDHQHGAADEHPGDGLGNRAEHEREGVQEDPPAGAPVAPVSDAPREGEQAERDDDSRRGEEHLADEGGLAVETHLPREVQAGLKEHDEPLEGHESPESDVHAGDDESHGSR